MRATSLALLATTAVAVAAQDSIECSDGLHMIVARGTGEDEGPGVTGDLAERVADRIDGSEVDGLEYPASLTDPGYIDSVRDGSEELRETINEYIKACPDSKLAVLGYSQGAQVASEVFCGGSGESFGDSDPLSTNVVESNIVAIVLFGDPSHMANATYNEGTAENDGIFPRDDIKACEDLGDLIVSYCDAGDTYCDGGDERNGTVHGLYIERYGDDVVDFIVDRYESGGDDGSSSTSTETTVSPTSSGTSSPSATESGSPTTTTGSGGAAATETGDPEDMASGVVPGLGLIGLLSLAVLGLM